MKKLLILAFLGLCCNRHHVMPVAKNVDIYGISPNQLQGVKRMTIQHHINKDSCNVFHIHTNIDELKFDTTKIKRTGPANKFGYYKEVRSVNDSTLAFVRTFSGIIDTVQITDMEKYYK